jgi:tetratricopeptide (TPR) repeat protein
MALKKKSEAIDALEIIARENGAEKDGLQAQLMLAQIKAADKDIAGAKELLEKVLAANPSDLNALALRGSIAVKERRFVDAIGDLRTVVKERAEDIKSVQMLALAHANNNEADLAIDLLHKAVKLHGNDRKLRMTLAELLARKNDLDGAAAQYEALLAQKPDDKQTLIALAKLYQAANKGEKLAEIADKMLGHKDSMAVGFYYQGLLKIDEGKFDEARELFEKSLAITPTAVEPTTALVKSWLAQKQWQPAVKRLDAMLATQPVNATLYNLKAECQLIGNDLAGAEDSLKKAIEVNPKWWLPYRTLASLRLAQKDPAGAQKFLEAGIAAADKSPMLRMELALLHEREGRIDDSIAVYRQMVDEGLTGDTIVNNLAMLLASKADAASLDAAYSYSAKLATSDNPLFLDTAGWVQYKRGDYQAALPILKKAVELAPEHPQIRYHLGVTYFRNNQLQEAKDNLSLALKDEQKFEGRDDAEQVLQKIQKS